MEYEYKSLIWDKIGYDEKTSLNELFAQGWEYVHGFSQSVSTSGNGYNIEQGNILVILKKKKESVQL